MVEKAVRTVVLLLVEWRVESGGECQQYAECSGLGAATNRERERDDTENENSATRWQKERLFRCWSSSESDTLYPTYMF